MTSILILGGGWYGCHLALALKRDGYEVLLHEKAERLFSGASGNNPARLHLGFHYPRTKQTRDACQKHFQQFMDAYGHLTRRIPENIYAIAEGDSLVDFGSYRQLVGNLDGFPIDPNEAGLVNCEGAIQTAERHIRIDLAREYFTAMLGESLVLGAMQPELDTPAKNAEWVIDCTFCSQDEINIQRFEPCIMGLMEGPTNKAVTIMDGPFPSLYPWNEEQSVSSLTSAKFTPVDRVRTYAHAREVLDRISKSDVDDRIDAMRVQLCAFWPESWSLYKPVDAKLSIRAMPRSGADARLVDVIKTGPKRLRIRAGKIDAVLWAENLVKQYLTEDPLCGL